LSYKLKHLSQLSVTPVKDKSAKSTIATPPVASETCCDCNTPPPATYCPEAATSLVAVYEVVAELKTATDVYNPNLNVRHHHFLNHEYLVVFLI
jgi:hypothetical protein